MSELDIIIPVYNEAGNINELLERIDRSLSGADIDYNVIFVDDHSTDSTVQKVKEASRRYIDANKVLFDSNNIGNKIPRSSRIKLFSKRGKKGKAYSILEGVKHSESEYVAMIDGDLQYPPEAIPELFKIAQRNGIAVADRKIQNIGAIRKTLSKINIWIFEKVLLGLNCDTQSGLKVFKRDIGLKNDKNDITPWTLDMPLLLKAKDMGYKIGTYDIEFSERKSGSSKVNIFTASVEIALSAIRLKLRNRPVLQEISTNGGSYIGSGVSNNGKNYKTHSKLPESKSALKTFYFWQKILILEILLVFFTFLLFNPKLIIITVITLLTLVYSADLIFGLRLLIKSLNFPPEIKFNRKEIERIDESKLPIYTILSPLYKEKEVLVQFVEAIKKMDWPKDKLDVQLLLEEDDKETQEAAINLNLPKYFRIVIVPDSQPKTKPKACNYGFGLAKGEYLVIYDAEDRPDPLQLKKAYIAFKKSNSKVVCLQSKLNYYNTDQNIITRLFTAEYSLWFDLILPGLQSIEATIPLGGTSNHFKVNALRYLDGWDPFNVTEDCDLGARLFKEGFKTAIIDSTTYEEANSKLKSWLKQRSRWIKGYWQTYLVHMRDPISFFRKHGYQALVFQLTIGLRMTFILINPILWTVTALYFILDGHFAEVIESLYPAPVFYLATLTLVFGNFIYFYNYMIGLAKRRQWKVMKYTFLVPVYWAMTSVAAGIAFYQLLFKPHHWEKTKHGLHLGINNSRKLFNQKIDLEIIYFDPTVISNILRKIGSALKVILKNVEDILSLLQDYPQTRAKNGRNILIFNWRDTKHIWSGGAEIYLHEIAKRWVRSGNEVTVFCGWDGISKREEFVDGVRMIRRGGFYTVYLYAFLYYIFKFRNKFDVIVDSANGIPFFSPLYAEVPVILLIHHVHQNVFRENLIFPLSNIAQFMEAYIMPSLYKGKKIVTISGSSEKDIVKRGWADYDDISIVNPGVKKVTTKSYKKTTYPLFSYLGRLKAYKNIDIAVKAFSKVVVSYPNALFYIAGKGDYAVKIEKLVTDLGLEENVKLLGFVDEDKKIELLSRSWACVQPSSFEGWGITVIEANSCSTPVIASNVNGLSDSVLDGKTGLLFEDRNIKDLKNKMIYLIENSDSLSLLTKQAYEWSKGFSWERSSERFLYEIEKVSEEESGVFADDIVIEHSYAYDEIDRK
ncbi:glycosyltransferase [Candidatus Woesebacteria bacterium]|nr:glycosyltransferase [Candidatus Woesebacteria bacterium]